MVTPKLQQLRRTNSTAKTAPLPTQQSNEEQDVLIPSNLMFNRRVVRGNTYSAQILPGDMPMVSKTLSKKTLKLKQSVPPPKTPDPVDGRRHIELQTDSYLEQLTDSVAEAEMSTQTDPFKDRPSTPLFIPAKAGLDATTQIEAGDLFDFDFEVEPLLEVLVGKCLEQGLMEVMEEEELAAMRAHQQHYEQVKAAELASVQRLEAAELRKQEEKARRLEQARARASAETHLREKVAAATFARGYIKGLTGTVYGRLQDSGFSFDPVQREIEQQVMPWLKEETEKVVAQHAVARAVVARVVADAVAKAQAQAAEEQAARDAAKAEYEAELARTAAAEAAAKAEAQEVEAWKRDATAVLAALDTTHAEKITEVKAALEQQNGSPPTDEEVFTELLSKSMIAKDAIRSAMAAAKQAADERVAAEAAAAAEQASVAEAEAPAADDAAAE
ncbi:hypothetical protein ABBQ38_007568 [Trebouxia sp. C0009 RCD-2024]